MQTLSSEQEFQDHQLLQVVTAILLQCSQNLKIWCDDRYRELSIK